MGGEGGGRPEWEEKERVRSRRRRRGPKLWRLEDFPGGPPSSITGRISDGSFRSGPGS